MRTARTLAAATLGTAAVSLGLVAAAPAAFAGVDKGPADQQVISEHGPFEISASESVSSLDVTGPQGQPAGPVERSAEGRPSLIFDTACLEAPQPECAGGPVAANGAWTIQVSGVGEERRTFFLRIGGFPVTEVVAELAERTATVTWKPGPEPDVTGWRVSDDQGAVQTVPKDVCDEEGETCSAVFAYPPSATGDRTFSVRAARSCGLEGCPDVLGAPAKSNVVTLPKAKAQPQPTDSGTPSPSGDTAAPSPSSTTAPGAPARAVPTRVPSPAASARSRRSSGSPSCRLCRAATRRWSPRRRSPSRRWPTAPTTRRWATRTAWSSRPCRRSGGPTGARARR